MAHENEDMGADAMPAQDVNDAAATSGTPINSDDNSNSAPASRPETPTGLTQEDSASPADRPTDDKPESKSLKELIDENLKKMTGEDSPDASTGKKDPEKTDSDADTPPEKEGTDEAKKQTDNTDDDVSDEEKAADEEWRSHPATKAIFAERKKARAERDEALQKAKEFETDAKQYGQLRAFQEQYNVNDTDAATALKMAALAMQDPRKFAETIRQMADQWSEHTGISIPNDIQQRLDAGLIDEATAQELALARADSKLAATRNEQVVQKQTKTQAETETQYREQLFENWAGQVSKTDTDLQRKLPMIVDRMRGILAKEGDPGSPQAAWDRLNRAYKEVNDQIGAFRPAPKPTNPTPRTSGVRAGSTPNPKNFEEAFDSAFAQISAGG